MIKHEIRWEYILVICIILGTLPCNAQSVIPMPKEMVMGEGSWDVSADITVMMRLPKQSVSLIII